ncbi:mce related family protein [Mycobacterium kansasii]|uniref:Mce related family protein n=1 Tax=Mycobacterium kansasii TaxID=1768 RepID=A0A1V3X710_MYCKA|nr:mce related family protein [Mycobacterium kansasii]
MLTRFVRIQLAIFTIVGIVGVVVMVLMYIQAPTLLGIGRITVTLEVPAAGGLYRFSNVTYRGVQVGKVTAVGLTSHCSDPKRSPCTNATLSLGSSPKIPADLQADVRSISAVGEQYVDLRPRTNSPPYLHNGSVIPMSQASVPQPIGPVLDQTSALIDSIPKDKLVALLDEAFKGFNGAGYDFGSLFDSAAKVSGDLNGVADRARTLTEDTGPVLDSQAQTTDAIRLWARSLAGVTGQLVTNDPQVRTLLEQGPGAFDEASRLLEQIKPTLPVLLANLTTVGQIAVTYHASLEQVLVLLPPFVAAIQSFVGTKNPTGYAQGDFAALVDDPPGCTVGFLPPSQWRSPADTTTIDTPDGLYCKLPQDSPISVRGARNYPCIEHPGKRAPTVEICDSDQPFEPLAMRQHVFGTYPLDPNLLAQGIPPDDRVNFYRDRIFGPVEGTPLPPGSPGPRGTPPGPPSSPVPLGQPPIPPGSSVPPPANLQPPVPVDLAPVAPMDVPDGAPRPGWRAASRTKRLRPQRFSSKPGFERGAVRPPHRSLRRSGRSAVSAVRSGQGAQDLGGHALGGVSGDRSDLVEPERHHDDEPLVDTACAAGPDRLVFARECRRPGLDGAVRPCRIEGECLHSGERGAVGACFPVGHFVFDGPHHSVMHVERCAPTLVAGHPTGAVLGGGTTGRYGPGAADGRFVMKRLIRLGPFTDGRGAVGSVDGGAVGGGPGRRRCARGANHRGSHRYCACDSAH